MTGFARKTMLAVAAATMTVAPAAPALAGWKLIEPGEQVKVAKGPMQVTPVGEWNRWTSRPVKKSETWTLDGTNLNEVYFISGLPAGQTLYKDRNKKEAPLPKFKVNADITDIPDFVESSMRVALQTSVFELTGAEPASMGGQDAVRFTFEYAVEGSPLKRKGMATGTIKGGNLYLITYVAPATYFYDRDLAAVTQIMDSAAI